MKASLATSSQHGSQRSLILLAFTSFLMNVVLSTSFVIPNTRVHHHGILPLRASAVRKTDDCVVDLSKNPVTTFGVTHTREAQGERSNPIMSSNKYRAQRRRPWNRAEENQASSWLKKAVASVALITTVAIGTLTTLPISSYADTSDVGICLLKQCSGELTKCIVNPRCLANVICINTCVGRPDEGGCQIKCGNLFENDVVGEFNKCAVSDKDCVPQRQDDGSYPVPSKAKTVNDFNTNLFNGRWYITAGQNDLFDRFPCQVHFFTETEPGTIFG